MRILFIVVRALAVAALASLCVSKPVLAADVVAVPTFESLGLMWSNSGGSAAIAAHIRFRPKGTARWFVAGDMWFDPRAVARGTPAERPAAEYRGSLLSLASGTTYEIQLWLDGQCASLQQLEATTWSDTFALSSTTIAASTSSTQLLITAGGTDGGYALYVGGTIDVGMTAPSAIEVRTDHVIIRGFTLRGGRSDAIRLGDGAHDVIIEGNDISGWGALHDDSKYTNPKYDYLADGGYRYVEYLRNVTDGGFQAYTFQQLGYCDYLQGNEAAAVHCYESPTSFTTKWQHEHDRIVVQRNTIHDPGCGAGQWWHTGRHPRGTNGITLSSCGGNHVIRYNDIISRNPARCFMDGVSGGENFSWLGTFAYDSDIYGNRIEGACDDALEIDGANRNTRVFGNTVSNAYVAMSFASNSVGPAYAFRNIVEPGMPNFVGPLVDPANRRHTESFLKTGTVARVDCLPGGSFSPPCITGDVGQSGRLFVVHNTVGWLADAGEGAGWISSGGGAQDVGRVFTRNNIVQTTRNDLIVTATYSNAPIIEAGDWDFDYLNGRQRVFVKPLGDLDAGASPLLLEAHAVWGRPSFDLLHGWALAANDPGLDVGRRVAGFNDAFEGAGPDLGAQERGAPELEFGPLAYDGGQWRAGGTIRVSEPPAQCLLDDAGTLGVDAGGAHDDGVSPTSAIGRCGNCTSASGSLGAWVAALMLFARRNKRSHPSDGPKERKREA